MGKGFCKIEDKWCKFCKRDKCDFSGEKVDIASMKSCPKRDAKLTISFKDMLELVDFEKVMDEMDANYSTNNDREGYKEVFDKLRTMTPQKIDWFINISWVHEDGDPKFGTEDVDWISTDGISPRGETYAIEFEKWDHWLGMNFTKETLANFSYELIVASCLWEMTYNGYTEDEVQEFRANLFNTFEEMKKENEKEKKKNEK